MPTPNLITIADVLYTPEGELVSGEVSITNTSTMLSPDGYEIPQGTTYLVNVVDGVLNIGLVPNIGSTPTGTSYLVTYKSVTQQKFSEYWVVPGSGPVTLQDVRSLFPPVPTPMFAANQIIPPSGMVAGQVLTWNGSGWIPGSGGGASDTANFVIGSGAGTVTVGMAMMFDTDGSNTIVYPADFGLQPNAPFAGVAVTGGTDGDTIKVQVSGVGSVLTDGSAEPSSFLTALNGGNGIVTNWNYVGTVPSDGLGNYILGVTVGPRNGTTHLQPVLIAPYLIPSAGVLPLSFDTTGSGPNSLGIQFGAGGDIHYLILGTGGSGGISRSLPPVNEKANFGGLGVTVVKVDAGAGAITLTPYSGDTIVGQSSYSTGTAQYSYFSLISDGVNTWYVSSQTTITPPVTSVFGRTGDVVATATDYAAVDDVTVTDTDSNGMEVSTATGLLDLTGTNQVSIAGGSATLNLGDVEADPIFTLTSGNSTIGTDPTGEQLSISTTGGLTVTDQTGSVWGAATDGAQGAGTLNAVGLFVNGAAVLTSAPAGAEFQVNGTDTTSQTLINFTSGTDTSVSNPSAGNVQIDFTGQLAQSLATVSHKFFTAYDASTGLFTAAQPAYTDISGTPQLAQTISAVSHEFLTSYTASTGLFTQAQPAYSDLSGTPQLPQTDSGSTHHFLTSYTASTGLFTDAQPAFTDISGTLATASQLDHNSIGLTDSTGLFTISGSPAALGGGITLSAFASQTANTVLRSGSGTPSFSALTVTDLPTSGTWTFTGTLSGALTFTANDTSTLGTATPGTSTSTAGFSLLQNTTPTVTGANTTLALSTSTAPSNISGNTWQYTYAATETGSGSNAYVGASVTISGYTGGATGNNGTFIITASTTTNFQVTNASGTATNTGTPVIISSAVVNSPIMQIAGTVNTGTAGALASAADAWSLQNVIGSVVPNPVSSLTLTHTGTSGAAYFKAPNFSPTAVLPSGSSVIGLYSFSSPGNNLTLNGNGSSTYCLQVTFSGTSCWGLVNGDGVGGNAAVMTSTGSYVWSANSLDNANDTQIARNAAGILGIGSGLTIPTDWSGGLKASGFIGSSISLAPLSNVGTVTVTPTGGSASTWTYVVVAKDINGNVCAASSAFSTTTGAATLTGAAFNTLTWTAIAGAASYDVYRTVHATSPTTTGKIGNVAANVNVATTGFKDTGLAGDSTTAPSINLTGSIQLSASAAAPTSAGTPGTAGQILYNGGLLYFCSVSGAAGSATWNKLNMTAV